MQAGGASANSVSGVFTRAARCSPTTHFTQSSLDRAVSDDLALDDSKRRLCPDPLCPPTTHNALCRPVCSPTRSCTTCRISLFAPSALVWTAPPAANLCQQSALTVSSTSPPRRLERDTASPIRLRIPYLRPPSAVPPAIPALTTRLPHCPGLSAPARTLFKLHLRKPLRRQRPSYSSFGTR